eukprot:SAG25_NODE_7_length_29214_cov_40.245818_25_plen_105_part_00
MRCGGRTSTVRSTAVRAAEYKWLGRVHVSRVPQRSLLLYGCSVPFPPHPPRSEASCGHNMSSPRPLWVVVSVAVVVSAVGLLVIFSFPQLFGLPTKQDASHELR